MTTEKLDLRDVCIDDVKVKTENFVLNNQHSLPINIITRDLKEMKSNIKNVLNYYGFKYIEESYNNTEYIKIIN